MNAIALADLLQKQGAVFEAGLQSAMALGLQLTGDRYRYRQLLAVTREFWTVEGTDYTWVANRLGYVMEAFGLRIDALSLHYKAWRGRGKLLGLNH